MAQEVTIESSRGAIALRELKENYFCSMLGKWIRTASNVFDIPSRIDGREIGPKTAQERFASIISGIMPDDELGAYEKSVTYFSSEMKRVESDIKCRLEKYVPRKLRKKLIPRKDHNNDPLRVLSHLQGAKEGLSGVGEFEFVRAMEMAAQYFFISVIQNHPENGQPEDELQKLDEFARWLRMDARIEKRETVFYLDENKGWRCRIFKHTPRKKKRAGLRKLTLDLDWITIRMFLERKIEVVEAVLQSRKKDHLEAFARRFRDPQIEMITDVPDMHGIRFAYKDNSNLNKGTTFISSKQVHHDCRIKKINNANRHASGNIKLVSQNVYLNGKTREVQHILLRDMINVLHSSCSENHALYHLRWYTEKNGLFSQLFPKELYGIDWEDEQIRQMCQKHIINGVNKKNNKLPSA